MSSTVANPLATKSSSGIQATTQDPQTPAASTLNGQTSVIQRSVDTNSLTSTGGIPIITNGVTSPALISSTSQSSTTPTTTHHGLNPFLLTVSILLFLVAIVIFASTTRSAKTTTK